MQAPHYPIKYCIVEPEDKIDEKGKPTDRVYGNRLVRFCCKGCTRDFKKNPSMVLKELDRLVIEKQKAKYPLDTCLMAGEKLTEVKMNVI